MTSRDVAHYLTAGLGKRAFVTAAYDDLTLDRPDWLYHQTLGIAGTVLSRRNWRTKLHYAHLDGRFSSRPFPYSYSDKADMYSAELQRDFTRNRFGAGYQRYVLIGYQREVADNYSLRFARAVGPKTGLQVQPNFTRASHGRGLFSVGLQFDRQVWRALSVRVGGFIGKRAFYFDNELLVLHNQLDSQTGRRYARARWMFTPTFGADIEWLRTSFADHHVAYLAVGLHAHWPIRLTCAT